jgi:hypothetical protein
METTAVNQQSVRAVLGRSLGEPLEQLALQSRPIRGGLESPGLVHVTARYLDRRGRVRRSSLVVKQLRGAGVRELSVYRGLVAGYASDSSPRLVGAEWIAADQAVLYLEALRPAARWPWKHTDVAGQVIDRLAELHASGVDERTATELSLWDYEAELQRSSELTLEALQRCRRDSALAALGPNLPALRRIVLSLSRLRRQLLGVDPRGSVAIHGDMHTGNALLRRKAGSSQPAFLDWGRARLGSPLEDVSSWLQSLGYWEPEGRRRHDTLLVRYLRSRGDEARLTRDLRVAYWLAGASNALAGALRYHLAVAVDPSSSPRSRLRAIHSARDWLRVIRRADAGWH